ncbi:MAG: tetratricopeptide repeat protein [Lentisphaerales bacterium]|jgi:tetratricopeptide (TPR) repeat protein|nr:MAG: tetratricopeptide repeat protein [Lentisphaerales bacterium]
MIKALLLILMVSLVLCAASCSAQKKGDSSGEPGALQSFFIGLNKGLMRYRQVSANRQSSLSPETALKVARLHDAAPFVIYKSIISELSEGRQKDAEGMLAVFVRMHARDQRLAFAQAVCSRSRWSKITATQQFFRVLDMDPNTIEGKCARHALALDEMRDVDGSFRGLKLLADENPRNPFPLWLIGIYSREYCRRTGKTDRGEAGVEAYTKLLSMFEVGPVLLHQTFANILAEELGRPEEALKHRRIAVTLEPAVWNYEGLANTLSALKQYDEADEIFARVVEMRPGVARQWHNWAVSLEHQKKWAECVEKSTKSLECDSDYYKARKTLGYALESQGQLAEALDQYEKTIQTYPRDPYAYNAAARVHRKLGQPEKAEEFLQQLAVATGGPRKVSAPLRPSFTITPVSISPVAVTMNINTEQSFAIFYGMAPYSIQVTDPLLGSIVPGPVATNGVFGVQHTCIYYPATPQRGPVATNYVRVLDASSNSATARIVQWQ